MIYENITFLFTEAKILSVVVLRGFHRWQDRSTLVYTALYRDISELIALVHLSRCVQNGSHGNVTIVFPLFACILDIISAVLFWTALSYYVCVSSSRFFLTDNYNFPRFHVTVKLGQQPCHPVPRHNSDHLQSLFHGKTFSLFTRVQKKLWKLYA
jgi:hypothetical protein